MFRKISAAIAVFALIGVLPYAFGAVSPASAESACVCCGDTCSCEQCVCSELDCACVDGGRSACTVGCCQDCCSD